MFLTTFFDLYKPENLTTKKEVKFETSITSRKIVGILWEGSKKLRTPLGYVPIKFQPSTTPRTLSKWDFSACHPTKTRKMGMSRFIPPLTNLGDIFMKFGQSALLTVSQLFLEQIFDIGPWSWEIGLQSCATRIFRIFCKPDRTFSGLKTLPPVAPPPFVPDTT